MGKVVIWRETILCANFETKSEKQKKKNYPLCNFLQRNVEVKGT